MDTALQNGYVYTDHKVKEIDIGIRDGVIEEISRDIDADQTIDLDGHLVLPGLVNTHTHASMTLLRGYADDLPLQTWLEEKIWPLEANLEPTDIYIGAKLAALEMIKTGTTTFNDMYFEMNEVSKAVGETGLRAVLGHGVITDGKSEEEADEDLRKAVEFAEEYNGAHGNRVTTSICPHAPYTCSDEAMARAAETAEKKGLSLHIHLSETDDEVQGVIGETGKRPVHHLDDLGVLGSNTIAAHCVHLNPEEIEILSSKEVGIAHCPTANMKLASGSAPITHMLDKDTYPSIGTDGPASNNNLDMFSEIKTAALLAKNRENDPSAVPAGTALEMATRHGGKTLSLDTGAIERGRKADIISIDLAKPNLTPSHDLLSHAVYSMHGGDVSMSMVDGNVLMKDGDVLTMDEDEVIRDAQRAAMDLVERTQNG